MPKWCIASPYTISSVGLLVGLAVFTFLVGTVEEIAVRNSSFELQCVCGNSEVQNTTIYSGQGVRKTIFRRVWNVTNCQYTNGTTFENGTAIIGVSYNVNSWDGCKAQDCSSADACPFGTRRRIYFSPLHTLGYIRKHYSQVSVVSWAFCGVFVGFAVLIVIAALIIPIVIDWLARRRQQAEYATL